MSFNTFSSNQKSYGGSDFVWHEVRKRLLSGGTINPLPAAGTLIPGGTPVYIPEAGGVATFIEFFEVAAAVTAVDTVVKVRAGAGLPRPDENMPIMVMPNAVSGTGSTGKAVAITGVAYDDSDNTYSFNITANDYGVLDEGDILVKADGVGASRHIVAVPNALTWNDVYIKDGTHAATVAGVVDGIIYADRISPIPNVVKSLLPGILFQKGV